MPAAVHAVLLGVFFLSASIWTGGYTTLPIIARVATKELDPAARITFFRTLGRVHGTIGTIALIVALASGAGLMSQIAWGVTAWVTAAIGIVLVLALLVGMAQAREMTRLRRRLVENPDDQALSGRVARGARRATVLRAGLGVLTLALICLGCALAA